jgi:hypothetical protein
MNVEDPVLNENQKDSFLDKMAIFWLKKMKKGQKRTKKR